MKQSLFVVLLFILGCLAGAAGVFDHDFHTLSVYILYALMFQVGLSIGCSGNLKAVFKNLRPQILLLPAGTVVGTLIFSALAALLIRHSGWNMTDTMAVGSGLGYYSLSSILIMQLKAESLGVQLATQLGTIALLANVFREIIALVFSPWFARHFGPLAPIAAAGVTSVDVSLPAIVRATGTEMMPVAIFHGMALDVTIPILVPFICSL